jgi:hypothetical protein
MKYLMSFYFLFILGYNFLSESRTWEDEQYGANDQIQNAPRARDWSHDNFFQYRSFPLVRKHNCNP